MVNITNPNFKPEYDTHAAALDAHGLPSLVGASAITIKPSGDTDDYFTFSTVADVPTITPTGSTVLAIASDISLGANKLRTTNLSIFEEGASRLGLFLSDGTTPANLLMGAIAPQLADFCRVPVDAYIATYTNDSRRFGIRVPDNGVGVVEVMGFQGAADPYVQIGRDDTGVALNAVTDMLVLQAGAGTNNEAANFGLGISLKVGNAASQVEERASIDLVLTDATDASEDVELNVNLMIAGVAPAEVASFVGGGIDLPTGKILSVAGTQVVGARGAAIADAPAGGTGTAAGGWDTAANRDAAIASINAIIARLEAHGLIAV